MGLSSVLSTSTTGLSASETTIDVVGNNIANSNTVGFKSSTVVFATQFLQTLSLGSAPTDSNGGTNPRQTGLGVQVASVTPNFGQGTVQLSSSSTDFAIQGAGFFITQGGQGEQLYTRNGVFQLNASNEIVTATGERVLGYGIDDEFQVQTSELVALQIPLGNRLVAQETSTVELTGNLSSTGNVATTAEILESGILGDAASTAPADGPDAATAAIPGSTTTGAEAAGGVLDALATYQYKVVFYDSQGTESVAANTTLSVTLTGANQQVQLNNIPTTADTNWVGRRVYRTDGGGSTFKLLTTIADRSATTSFADNTADGSLGATLNTNTLTGEYTYYVTFADQTVGGGGLADPLGTESRPVVATSIPNVSGSRIKLTDIPTDTSGQWATRRIYRNRVGFPNDFTLIAEVPNNTDTTYTDYVQDSAMSGNEALNFDGPTITANTLLTNVLRRQADGTYDNMFTAGELSYNVRKGTGTSKPTIATKTLTIDSSTTVQNLLTFINDSAGIVPHSSSDPTSPPLDDSGESPGLSVSGGRIQVVANNGEFNALQITQSDLRQSANIDLGFSSTQAAVGSGGVTTFRVFDTQGDAVNIRLTMAMESRDNAETVYRWYADSDDNAPLAGTQINVGTGLVRFDSNGRLTSGSTTDNVIMQIDRDQSPADSLNVTLDFSQVTGLATGSNTIAAPRTDGFPAGQLTGFLVGEDGLIKGVFDNGASRDLGQIRLARFANPAGLEAKGQNSYAPGVNSGLPIEGNPGDQGIGSIISGAQELSNTDIGKNLIDLILAQTQYRGNTRVISAAQNLLDELLNLRR